jgi:hypothetical protein
MKRKIKIIQHSHPYFWYRDYIGEIYEVIIQPNGEAIIIEEFKGKKRLSNKFVKQGDFEILI